MTGFFPAEITKAPVTSFVPKCGLCGLYKGCLSPKMPVSGGGRKGILICAGAPGKDEDEQEALFVGESGRYLRKALQENGIDLDRDCWKTNALICRPDDDRLPTNNEIDYCRPNISNAIRELNPRLIMPLGGAAVRSVIGPYWRDAVGDISLWAGWKIPLQALNCWVTPNFHPGYVLDTAGETIGSVVKVWFDRYLAQAVALQGRPWDVVPDYASQIQIMMDTGQAAVWIRDKLRIGGAFSFDYETDRLKPDHPEARIVCCSVCWNGKETIAYPWVGEAIVATRELCQSKCPKVGGNAKFESRWTERVLGCGVENWVWDVVLAQHILDNRRGITSVKFAAFTRLGLSDYSYGIKSFLSGEGGNGKNRIYECDLRQLLLYNGLDSKIQYELAIRQKQEMQNESSIIC